MKNKISVLVVDDSALVRQLLADMLSEDPGLEVAGTARDGVEAIKMINDLDPDVVTMDIYMPEMDGLTALEYIMKKCPRPVVMLSALVKKGAVPTLKALELGAVDFIAKPSQFPASVSEVRDEVIEKIKAAAGSRVRQVRWRREKPVRIRKERAEPGEPTGGRVVVMGASAGGPQALSEVIPALPEDLPAPVIVVQHMPGPFTGSFAERLDARSALRVKESEQEEILEEGQVLVVPGGWDMVLEKCDGGGVSASLLPTVAHHGASPVIDVTMESAAQVYGSRSIGVLLSGMGSDGALGMGMIRDSGGDTIAQDEETSLVFGMPRAAIERRFVSEVLPLEEIAKAILDRV